MFTNKKDFPPIERLNTVHHEGVPFDHIHEHFITICESTVVVLEFSQATFKVRVLGYYPHDKKIWHASWYTIRTFLKENEAKMAFYRVSTKALAAQSDRIVTKWQGDLGL